MIKKLFLLINLIIPITILLSFQVNSTCKADVKNQTQFGNDILQLSINIWLEGAFDGEKQMNTELNKKRILEQFEYNILRPRVIIGNITIPQMLPGYRVPSGAVDIIKIMLRSQTIPYKVVDSTLAWVMNNGTIRDYSTGLNNFAIFDNSNAGTYFVEIRHKNHLPIISNTAYSFENKRTIGIDFSNPKIIRGRDNSYKTTKTNQLIAMMVAGDVFKNSSLKETNAHDVFLMNKILNEGEFTNLEYHIGDVNLDGSINETDKKIVDFNSSKLYFFPIPME
ncbi:MAG: hypothetical protein EAZ07_03365 [Cytophagales bacterium]|nr:MAG: hypothetical protein EAZ07_03365 [Cytophagales bacterium]